MRSTTTLFCVLVWFACLVSCVEEDNAVEEAALAFEGIYQLEDFTLNTNDCTAEGSSVLSQVDESFFFVQGISVLGRTIVMAVSCIDAADCTAKASALRARQAGGGRV